VPLVRHATLVRHVPLVWHAGLLRRMTLGSHLQRVHQTERRLGEGIVDGSEARRWAGAKNVRLAKRARH
jgi:hypothetical protein